MKSTGFVSVWFPYVAISLLLFVECFSAPNVKTAFVPSFVPTPLEDLTTTDPSIRRQIPLLSGWVVRNQARIVGNPRLIIKDGSLVGVDVDYVNDEPSPIELGYKRFETPFALPSDVSEKRVEEEVWKKICKQGSDQTSDFFGSYSLGLNLVQGDKERIVYGIWYLRKNTTYTRYDSKKNKFVTSAPQVYLRRIMELAALPAPTPLLVTERPDLRLVTEEKEVTLTLTAAHVPFKLEVDSKLATVMEPVRVVAEWLDVQPVLRNGKIDQLKIVRVAAGTPLEKAGVRVGQQIRSIQGVNVIGLTEREYDQKMIETPVKGTFQIEVIDSFGKITRINLIQSPSPLASVSP